MPAPGNIDMSRFAQERLPPQVYLTVSYYQRWALAMERNLVERGYADAEELAAGHALRPAKPLKRKLTTDVVRQGMTRGSFYRQAQAPARFKPGDRVRTKNIHPPTHTQAAALRARTARRGATRARLPRIPGYGRDRQRRQSAMALHRGVRGHASCGARTPTRPSRCRSTRSSPISIRHDGFLRDARSAA